ncbi:hypothetical protein BFF99_10420 [Corynebacterium pseudotuberculosis]|nr:hypothetical protein BFF99_10420 [Corynebacterium pseudotuberculosis]
MLMQYLASIFFVFFTKSLSKRARVIAPGGGSADPNSSEFMQLNEHFLVNRRIALSRLKFLSENGIHKADNGYLWSPKGAAGKELTKKTSLK